MKKTLRILAALLLAFLMAAGDLAAAAAPAPAQAYGVRAEILAKSRKKKNTPTPAVRTEKATPAPEEASGGGRVTPTPVPDGPIIDPRSIADYIFAHGELPDNFITKKEARALGWGSTYRTVGEAAPGKSIGGDVFSNYERNLPVGKGLTYREADCWYTGGSRNAYRIIWSSDGRVWYTEDHYNTFTELFPTAP